MARTIVVTGAGSGVGLAAAKQFAAHGDDVVLVGRNPQRLDEAVDQVRRAGGGREPARYQADFESFAEVRGLAGALRDSYEKIDVLANNAGGIIRGDYRRTKDGFEATMQGNHLAPFLLTNLLRDRLAGGRVVNTASDAHRNSNLDPDDFVSSPERYSAWRSYGASKAANILFAAEAARRWPEIFSVSFHPGVVRTNFGGPGLIRVFYRFAPGLVSAHQAGGLLVWLATAPSSELVDGGYYVGPKTKRPTREASDPEIAAKLWDASVKAVGL